MMEKEKQWLFIYLANICTRCLSEKERKVVCLVWKCDLWVMESWKPRGGHRGHG